MSQLFRSALFLWGSNAAATALGFVFWAVVARLYREEDVGLASATIAAMVMAATIGQFGLGYGLIRFHDGTSDMSHVANWSLSVAGVATASVALIFVAGSFLWASDLTFLAEQPFSLAAFVLFASATSVNALQSSLLLARRRSEVILAANVLIGVCKVILAIAFSGVLSAFGIIGGTGLATILALGFCSAVLSRSSAEYRPRFTLAKPPGHEFLSYCLANHASVLLLLLPGLLLPLIVLNLHGATASAHFYVAWMMGAFVHSTSVAIGQSLFAERAARQDGLWQAARAALIVSVVTAAGMTAVFLLLGGRFLDALAPGYAEDGASLLSWVAVASIPAAVTQVYLALLRIQKANVELMALMGLSSILTLALSPWLMQTDLGIAGAGVALLVSQSVCSVVAVVRHSIAAGRPGAEVGVET